MTDLTHVENMRVAQAKIHLGDVRWYVVTANYGIAAGPYDRRSHADEKLGEIRADAKAESVEGDSED